MRLPGFRAEVSLYSSGRNRYPVGTVAVAGGRAVVPSQGNITLGPCFGNPNITCQAALALCNYYSGLPGGQGDPSACCEYWVLNCEQFPPPVGGGGSGGGGNGGRHGGPAKQ
jgi:hypothetical protein